MLLFGLLPVSTPLLAGQGYEVPLLRGGHPLHHAEPALEALEHLAERGLGFDVQGLSERREHEEDVTEFGLDPFGVARRRIELRTQLAEFLVQLVEESLDPSPTETDLQRTPMHLRSAGKRGHRARDPVHHTGPLLLALARLPVRE